MTITESFSSLASKQNGNFQKKDGKYHIGDGSFLHNTNYSTSFNYKNSEVIVKNELGHQNLGFAECIISLQPNNSEFEITTRSIISQIFNRKKTPLIVSCNDLRLKDYIEKSEAFLNLCLHAKKEKFEPTITGKNNTNNNFTILCEYSVLFRNKELVLEPISEFLKSIVDFFE